MFMIKARDCDSKRVLSYLKERPRENGFFIGDLENFSLDEDFLDLWLGEGEEGRIASALLRHNRGFLASAGDGRDLAEMGEIIGGFPRCDRVSGLEETIDRLASHLPFAGIIRLNLAVLTGDSFRDEPVSLEPERVGEGDLDELFDFLKGIREFDIREEDRKAFGKGILTGTGRGYLVRREGRMVSSAQINAENSLNGVIVGVATDPAWRNRGFARACVSRLCRDMTGCGKEVTLFYNNPDAGKLYRPLGFRDIGRWARGNL